MASLNNLISKGPLVASRDQAFIGKTAGPDSLSLSFANEKNLEFNNGFLVFFSLLSQ